MMFNYIRFYYVEILFGVVLVLGAIMAEDSSTILNPSDIQLVDSVEHKPLVPYDQYDIIGISLICLGLMIAASGGIGGGGIVVPLLILVLGFQAKHAVALSNFTILGSSIMNMILNVSKKHPFAKRPLVDWDLILVMEPLTMIGAVIGAYIGKILPDWLLTISLVILLAHTTYTTLDKAKSQYKKETKLLEEQKKSILVRTIAEEEEQQEEESLIQKENKKNIKNIQNMGNEEDTEQEEDEEEGEGSTYDYSDHHHAIMKDESLYMKNNISENNSDLFLSSQSHPQSQSRTHSYKDNFTSASQQGMDTNNLNRLKTNIQQKSLTNVTNTRKPTTSAPSHEEEGDGGFEDSPRKDFFSDSNNKDAFLPEDLYTTDTTTMTTTTTDIFEKEIHVHDNTHHNHAYHIHPHQRKQLLYDLKIAESKTPIDRVIIMSSMVIFVMLINLIKGGGSKFPSILGIQCGSSSYWLLTFFMISIIFLISLYARSILISKWKLKKQLHYHYLEGDVEWNPINTIKYPSICFIAGLFAGMFGIGGGIVKGPLMLQMGVHPLVASATVAVMIMFTSVSATTMYVTFGLLQWDYAWFLFIAGLLSTIIGQFGVSYLVEKYKRYSYISISIGAVVAISTILMGLQSIFDLTDDTKLETGESSSIC